MRRILSVGTVIFIGLLVISPRLLAADQQGIPPATVADFLHSVIEADRTFYTIHVVERLEKGGGTQAAENWRAKKDVLPLPAQFLIESSELAATTGAKIRYRLISLWPINPTNAPDSPSERRALELLQDHPEGAVTETLKRGEEAYFQAIYADRAVSQSCVACHNGHPRSKKKDFAMHDVMGGLVIEIPLER
ncbi:MAG TPA: DUF3365 domain-containing protein [Nitrospira sp.]|jgi:Protein of unknown function (DUF3365)|nr:DUF3365 domain-containing protein [Nitrospira sp.]